MTYTYSFVTESVVVTWLAAGILLATINAVGLLLLWKLLRQVQVPSRILPTQPAESPTPIWVPSPAPLALEHYTGPAPLFTIWDASWFSTKLNIVNHRVYRGVPDLVLEQELMRAQRDLREIANCHPDHPDSAVLSRRAEKVQIALSSLFKLSEGRILVTAYKG